MNAPAPDAETLPGLPSGFAWDLHPWAGYSRDPTLRAINLDCSRGREEVARVKARVDGAGWVAEVGRYRPDWTKRHHVITPSRELACEWVARWVNKHEKAIRQEVDALVRQRRREE